MELLTKKLLCGSMSNKFILPRCCCPPPGAFQDGTKVAGIRRTGDRGTRQGQDIEGKENIKCRFLPLCQGQGKICDKDAKLELIVAEVANI